MATQDQTAPSAWRQFTFFDSVPVRDSHDLAHAPEIFEQKTPEISCIAATSLGTIVADIHGSIFILNREFEVARSWIGHNGGRVTHMVEQKKILITLGEEDSVKHPLLKVWDLGNFDKRTGTPILLRSVKVQSGNRPHPVTTIALSSALSYLAIGLGDGTVLLYRHLDQSIFSTSNNLTNMPKSRIIHESPAEPVTGLGFKEPDEDNSNTYLFIVTTNHVLSYQVTGRGSGGTPAVMDEVGAGLKCATMDWRNSEMVVAKDEAVYICGTEGRGACYAYEGPKATVHVHRNYLVLITPPFTPSGSAASATVRNFAMRNDGPSKEITKVTILDLDNKFVAFSDTFTSGVREIFSANREIHLLFNDGKLTCLEEKPTPTKLDMLYRVSQYLLALNLAKTQNLDESSVANIHKQYGDHLYAKGDYDGAMQQYLKTIGNVQPSYVIRKFLDAQRIHNLATYLQDLHAVGLANSEHTTLLLNTYTKLKDVNRLDSFIKTESRRSSANGDADELPFDLDTAIRVCRQAGYFEHASYLAKKYDRHEDYLQIQIEDAGNYKDALAYLRRLGTGAAESNLARYGRAMLESLPEETTQLLIDVCTSLAPLTIEPEDQHSAPSRQASTGGPSYLSYLALNRVPAVVLPGSDTAAPAIASVQPSVSRQGSVANDDPRSTNSTPPPITPSNSNLASARVQHVKRPSPRLYFAHFIDDKERFIRFLETVALKRWGQSLNSTASSPVPTDPNEDAEAEKKDQVAVWNTLLELYLSYTSSPDTAHATTFADQANKLLKTEHLPYDPTHALILCSTRSFTPGLVLLWERLGMYEDVLRFWMDKHKEGGNPDASAQVIRCLRQYGPEHAHLYPLVLRFLTSTPELLSKHTKDVVELLEHIDEEGIMPPLAVVQVLTRNGVASVGLVKQWLMTRITDSREQIDTDQKLIESYRMETQNKLKLVDDLADPDHPRVFHVTQCTACKGQLDLPSVHFMCNHSYHQRCLGEHDTECPNCVRNHGMIREIRRNNERLAGQHDVFVSEVKEGGFGAVATGFSRGIMNMSRLDDVVA
ncbi:hypothetical protein BXZ70DRAFT_947050 [Cristinia sonorae]|uniref:E3 ubiquitin-protein ligase PEP5 n=1 Tax=Cristinia sonorae TaxID=1940300 RepID=A0A8K0UKQ7_9AGAR|nr:hypothetical protein BXZ70DRAFT_947050 [Cristinia sonorae]